MKKILTAMVMASIAAGGAFAATMTVINPNGQSYIQESGKAGPIPGMSTLSPGVYMATVPRPASIDDANSRLTFAVDICMVGGYEQAPNDQHIIVASRVNPSDFMNNSGNNAWGGTSLGSIWGTGRVYSEERGVNPTQNLFWGANGATIPPNDYDGIGDWAVGSYHWYRVVTDTVRYDGGRLLESRVYRITDELNNVVEQEPMYTSMVLSPYIYGFPMGFDMLSSYDAAYPLGYDTVMLAHAAATSSANSNFIVGRIAAYWSNATEWVAHP